jgi:hypothetical protein
MSDVPPRRTGRPSLNANGGGESPFVLVRLPPQVYDQVYAISKRERCSMPEVLREALAHELKRKQHDEQQ